MSDPKVKPSIAARELANSKAAIALAEKCRNLSAPYDYATLIQAELRDLLECLNQQTCSINCEHEDCNKIHATIAPWKTTI